MTDKNDIPHLNLSDQKAGDGSTSHDLREYSNEPRTPMFKKIGRFFKKVAKGEGIAGKIVFGVLDVIPFPNVHEIVKSVLKDPEVSFGDGARMFAAKIDWARTIIGVALVVAFVMGWISIADLKAIAAALFGGA